MIGSLFGSLQSTLNSRAASTLWTPKSSRIMVGRDVGALTATSFSGTTARTTVVGHGDDVTLKSRTVFDMAKAATQSGLTAKAFRDVSDRDIEFWKTVTQHAELFENDSYSITCVDGNLEILDKNATEPGKGRTHIEVTEDMRLAWNQDGSLKVLTGAAARTKGVLAAQGENEILIRASGTAVEAGQGSVVLNLSQDAGTYTGGSNVTFLGSYAGGTFSGMTGKVTYAGYFDGAAFEDVQGRAVFSGVFERSEISLIEGQGEFSGYFSASSVTALSEAGNRMSGLFLDACTVQGGEGDDTFSGRFIGGKVDGAGGNDTFGYRTSMSGQHSLSAMLQMGGMLVAVPYKGLEADFIDAEVDAGEGDDTFHGTMWGGTLNLGAGDDEATGVFSKATVNGGDGDDTLSAQFADGTTFNTGLGDDAVTLYTAIESTVKTDEGTNTITLGMAKKSNPLTWQTRDAFAGLDDCMKDPMAAGELRTNRVAAEKGETTLAVHNGEGVQTLQTNMSTEQSELAPTAALPDEAAQPEGDEEERDAQASAVARLTRTAIEAYTRISGSAPASKGSVAATVTTGNGETHTLWGAEREDTRPEPENEGVFRRTRRYNGFGAYEWDRKERIIGR